MVDDKSYTLTKAPSANSTGIERTFDSPKNTTINCGTVVRKTSAKRDIMAPKAGQEKKLMAPSVVQKMAPSRMPTAGIYAFFVDI